MNKTKVKDFIKEHKKELAIAVVAGAVGAVGGVICHKSYISKNYGDLIEIINSFGETDRGVSMVDNAVKFFKKATHSVQVMMPNYEQTIKQTFGDGTGTEFLKEYSGLDPNTIITGVLVGIKKAET